MQPVFDKHQYLLPTICHPRHCCKNIPYSLALRIRRFCTRESSFEARTRELTEHLLNRGYRKDAVSAAIAEAAAIPRQDLLLYKSLNKCNINNGGCWGTCFNNNNGSYHCSCPDGFVIGADGHICIDIDECFMKAHNCSQRCCNTIGGYRCMCYEGFELVDGICKDIDECSPRTRPCSHECFNYQGSYQCMCRSGYILQGDKTTCQDINECDVYNGGCSDVCTNTLGSYKCSCYEGYSLLGDEHMCGQINACIHASCKDGECLTTGHGYLCNCSLPHFAGRFCHEVVISTEVSHRSSTSILISSTLLTWLISWS